MNDKNSMTPEEIEREWFETTYRGDSMRQLTWRAVIMGSFLGGFMSLSNLYIGLKTGWGLGVAITACILSFTIWKSLRKIMPRWFKADMTILENNAMQSTASAAGYSTGGTLVSAIAAYLLVNGVHIGYGLLTAWVFFLAVLGVTMAIPMKRQMINIERLKFPSGIAAAETLKSLHGDRAGNEGTGAAKALFIWGGIGILIATVRDWFEWLPQLYDWFGTRLATYTISFEASLILMAAGAIMGFKVCLSLLIGGILNWGVLAPMMIHQKVIEHPAPTIVSTEALRFPVTVPAGHALEFTVVEAVNGPRAEDGTDTSRIAYRWTQSASYQSMPELVEDLNAPRLTDGSPNPLHEVVVFSEPEEAYRRGVLQATLPHAIYYESELALSGKQFAALATSDNVKSLLNVSEAEDRLTAVPEFPLQIPAGFTLPLTVTEGLSSVSHDFVWPEAAEYSSLRGFLRDLKARTESDGVTGPLSRVFDVKTGGDTLFIAAPSAATLLSFQPGDFSREEPGGYRNIVTWSLWAGAACMVTSGLLSFGFQWKTALRAFSGLQRLFSRRRDQASEDPLEAIEVPGAWFAWGMTVGAVGVVSLAKIYFSIPIWMGTLAVLLSFFLALVACRACGETDTTPVGAMGKITQLIYGAIAPRQMNTNLMTACITAGVADSASDLLIDLKSGYVLGANARKQFLAQFAGIFMGTAVIVPAFYLIVPDVSVLGSDKFPAPAAQVWASVAILLSNGLESLHSSARLSLLLGGLAGLIIPTVDKLFPKARKFTPSAMGLGLAFVIPFWNVLSMFIGGLIALILMKIKREFAEKYTIASASGVIAGESLMGIFITLMFALGWIG